MHMANPRTKASFVLRNDYFLEKKSRPGKEKHIFPVAFVVVARTSSGVSFFMYLFNVFMPGYTFRANNQSILFVPQRI